MSREKIAYFFQNDKIFKQYSHGKISNQEERQPDVSRVVETEVIETEAYKMQNYEKIGRANLQQRNELNTFTLNTAKRQKIDVVIRTCAGKCTEVI